LADAFVPTFRDFQRDVEHQLKHEGKCTKNERGQTVYRGYEAAVGAMFVAYMNADALAPLVEEFRKWNWEWSYDRYLLDLTARLKAAESWPLLKTLWAAVVAKRRTNYNKTLKARRAVPDKVPEALVTKTRALLLESLSRIHEYSSELGREADVAEYVAMRARVARGARA
jgi:hypothetical protein